MHEISICQSILNSLESELEKDQHSNVLEIHVKIGVLSCVDPKILEHVFKYVAEGTEFKNAVLKTTMLEVLAECSQCSKQFKVKNYHFVCPHCGSASPKIIEGNELTIYKIILEETSYAEINQ